MSKCQGIVYFANITRNFVSQLEFMEQYLIVAALSGHTASSPPASRLC
jgi:hypothetical protein